ncbi:hypothetical protein [Streptomyces anulatus]|uniref:hypothetical protein n=1 Tax=Streptomyces anulatus TaxID=1892 RepID=UPI002F90F7E9|nr:hypothetical protein OG882_39525 [Streptomyces anulatus]
MSELMIALVGGGGALLGAAVGGTAAVVAAKVQARLGQQAALLAYRGPLEAARRTAQREAYAQLLTAAHEFSQASVPALEPALTLLTVTDYESRGEPPEETVSERGRVRHRAVLAKVPGPGAVRIAEQHVRLEGGPHPVAEAARAVAAAVAELSDVFVNAETNYESKNAEGQDYRHGLEKNPGALHRLLVAHIDAFSDAATAHLNAVKVRP